MLEELVSVIEELQRRIKAHGHLLRQNEYRTRLALIDPVLEALGWKIGAPTLVLPEYDVSGKRADYALLNRNENPTCLLEAKKLDESLSNHRPQVVAYASELGIKYPALTNGNQWKVYDNSLLVPIEQRRMLEVEIADWPTATSALRLLFLWRLNQETETAILPSTPMESAEVAPQIPDERDWLPFTDMKDRDPKPILMRFPDGIEVQPQYWTHALIATAEWLIRRGDLTPQRCPKPNRGRPTIVNTEPTTIANHPWMMAYYYNATLHRYRKGATQPTPPH